MLKGRLTVWNSFKLTAMPARDDTICIASESGASAEPAICNRILDLWIYEE
jgi:hypothetical protein